VTREELVRETARRTGLTNREVQIVLSTLLDLIRETICGGNSVFIRGFGSFQAKKGRKRRVRDPRDNGLMVIPPRYRPFFKAYPALRDAVEESLATRVRVAFLCLGCSGAERVSLVGDFNEWNESTHPMQKLPDGSWFTELVMPTGRTISYAFSVDGIHRADPAYRASVDGNTLRQV
jgi:DNA-binding protein HU-beta